MTLKKDTSEQPILSNKHLKECKDSLAAEQESLYRLRARHGLERDQLNTERNTDTPRQVDLSTQQAQEVNQLKQRNNEIRMAMLERQAKEKDNLKRAF